MSLAGKFLEKVYPGAMWVEELFQFYQKANPPDRKAFEILLNDGDEQGALALVKKVLGIVK